MMLNKKQIRLLLHRLAYETVAEFGGYEVMRQKQGYSHDPEIGPLQAKLSMMLEAARESDRIPEIECHDCDGEGCSTCDDTGRIADLCAGADEEGG